MKRLIIAVAAFAALAGAGAHADCISPTNSILRKASVRGTGTGTRAVQSADGIGASNRLSGNMPSLVRRPKPDDAAIAEMLNTRYVFDLKILEVESRYFEVDQDLIGTKPWCDAVLSDEKTVEKYKTTLRLLLGEKGTISNVRECSYPDYYATNAVTGKIEPGYFGEPWKTGATISVRPKRMLGNVVTFDETGRCFGEPSWSPSEFGEEYMLPGGRSEANISYFNNEAELGVPKVERLGVADVKEESGRTVALYVKISTEKAEEVGPSGNEHGE